MSNPDSTSRDTLLCGPDEVRDLTDDGFLDERLNILQPRKGYRAGLDAIMIAAAVPAIPGDRIIEAGSGTGVASLCLINQVPDLDICGLEINPHYAHLAKQNAQRNPSTGTFQVIEGDIAMRSTDYSAAGLETGSFAHAFANPPYRPQNGSRSGPDAGRNRAHLLSPDSLILWIKFLLAMVRAKGTISLILPAEMLDEALSLFNGRVGNVVVFPLFPHRGAPAKRVILQATKGTRTPLMLLAGLVLHHSNGDYTEQANAILRGNERLPLKP